jgi:hypothetical protein
MNAQVNPGDDANEGAEDERQHRGDPNQAERPRDRVQHDL